MEILEFAINMEMDGEKYYSEQAEINKDNNLKIIFLMLAKDEGNHARILKKKAEGIDYELKDESALIGTENLFQGIVDFGSKIMETQNQLEVYRAALEKEKQSIDFYEKYLNAETDEKIKGLFKYLVEQEKVHHRILEELVLLINRPNEWVESAEFGLRKEY